MNNINVKEIVENYINRKIWQSNENSNQHFSYSSVSWRLAGEVIEKYTLSEICPKIISSAKALSEENSKNLKIEKSTLDNTKKGLV